MTEEEALYKLRRALRHESETLEKLKRDKSNLNLQRSLELERFGVTQAARKFVEVYLKQN
jgi:hypothetical protein